MIISKIMGGLGNQMFQYAYAKNISLLNYYNTAFLNIISEDNILKMNRYDWHGRSLLQSPFTRLIYELRQLVKN